MKVSFFLALFTIAEGSKDAKILGGRLACKNEFPFVVALNGDWDEYCGGTLVTLNKVITAGHCVAFQTIFGLITRNIFVVTAGSIKRDIRTKADGMQSRHIISIQLHPSYKLKNSGGRYHDIAALILAKPFVLSRSVRPMKWIWKDKEKYNKAWKRYFKSGNNCTGVGWGIITKMTAPRVPSPDLKVVDMKPRSDEYCSLFSRYKGDIDMTKKGEVCLSPTTNGHGVCVGDSGGPLICGGYVFGLLISVYSECGEIQWPAKYLLFWPYMDLYNLGVSYSSAYRVRLPRDFRSKLLHFLLSDLLHYHMNKNKY